MWRERLIELLTLLDASQLHAFALAFGTLGRAASERAARITAEDKARCRAAAAVDTFRGAGRLVAGHIAEGKPPSLAVELVAAQIGAPVETVAYHFRRFARSRQAEAVEARRLAAVRLAWRGRSNDEIAEALGVSRRTVERALKGVSWSKNGPGASHPDSLEARTDEFRGREVRG